MHGEVLLDFMKLPIRNKKGRSEEWLVLGFIERMSGRCRGYLIPNIKQQTIVQYMAKTVEKGAILYTPFYSENGWDFLDKFYEHRRLLKEKSKDYFTEA
jgi:transposase-like protein